ncbi:putative cellulase [Helianthus anomalus]
MRVISTLGGTGWSMTVFGWDVNIFDGRKSPSRPVFGKYQELAENFMCACFGKTSRNVQKTPGGLIFRQRWNNLQFVTSAVYCLCWVRDFRTEKLKVFFRHCHPTRASSIRQISGTLKLTF